MLAILSAGACCDIDNSTSLGLCVGEILEAGRGEMKPQVDPQSLPDVNGTVQDVNRTVLDVNGTVQTVNRTGKREWRVKNASLIGLGNYSFENLRAEVGNGKNITIRFNITWSSVTVRALAEFRSCRTSPSRSFCTSLVGNLSISMNSRVGSGKIVLDVSWNDGKAQTRYRSSEFRTYPFTVNSVDISFNNVNGTIGGSASKTFKTELPTNYWKRQTMNMVVFTFTSELIKIADEYLTSRLNMMLPEAIVE